MPHPIHILIMVAAAHLSAQFIKVCRSALHGQTNFRLMLQDGNFPSAHSAAVTALALSILLIDGFTVSFTIAVVFAVLVINDALHLRSEVGLHARLLNKMKKSKLKENTGHNFKEVAAGVIWGAIVVFLYSFLL